MPLAVAVLTVMLQRGRSSDLIKGSAGSSSHAGIPSALLTNTTEQTFLAVLSLLAFTAAAPQDLGALVQVFVGLFCAGRLFFFVGYALNPMWRFYGFSLNFYSSVFLLGLAWWFTISAAYR